MQSHETGNTLGEWIGQETKKLKSEQRIKWEKERQSKPGGFERPRWESLKDSWQKATSFLILNFTVKIYSILFYFKLYLILICLTINILKMRDHPRSDKKAGDISPKEGLSREDASGSKNVTPGVKICVPHISIYGCRFWPSSTACVIVCKPDPSSVLRLHQLRKKPSSRMVALRKPLQYIYINLSITS